jgi:NDP-mannose synthase
MGINVFQRRAVSEIIQPGKYLDIPDLMLELKNTGYAVNCSNQDCDWLDIGRLDDYQVASELFEQRRADFLPQT